MFFPSFFFFGGGKLFTIFILFTSMLQDSAFQFWRDIISLVLFLKNFIFSVNLFLDKCIYLNNIHSWSYNFQLKIVRKYSQKTLNEIWKIQCIYFLNINSILCRKLLLFFKNTSGQKITHVRSIYWKTLVFENNQLELHHIHLWIFVFVSR